VSYTDYGYANSGPTGTAEEIYRAVEKLLESSLDADARVLDLGCGNGYFAHRLAGKGFSVVGMDASASGIEVASKAYTEVPFFCGNASALLQSGQAPFDVVVSVEVIEHCPSSQEFCADLAACLKPGGSAIITTPYHGYIKNVLIALLAKSDSHYNPLWEGGHIKFFSTQTITTALQSAGLTVQSVAYVGRVPWLAKSMVVHAIKPR
jgi:2-polyprenyl-3-methyl-5-hydroxy-6-metoxy-1,4-benzoquinol methylase